MKKISEVTQKELKNRLYSAGASKVGFANLDKFLNVNEQYSSGISILVKLNPQVIAATKEGPTDQYCKEYSRVNSLLNSLSQSACNFLIDLGHFAEAPKATAKTSELENLNVDIPHKTVASLSGMGWIGKNALLITEEFGSAVRLGSVFTNAVFEYDNPIKKVKCGTCTKCRDVCPGGAIAGQNWYCNIDLDLFYSPILCRNTINKFVDKGLQETICGICIANCPYTLRYVNNNK
ncbi:MAG: epoxyqueuosine reductase [bacterium]|nr:epoxyqueuosine reductase [bacterium]